MICVNTTGIHVCTKIHVHPWGAWVQIKLTFQLSNLISTSVIFSSHQTPFKKCAFYVICCEEKLSEMYADFKYVDILLRLFVDAVTDICTYYFPCNCREHSCSRINLLLSSLLLLWLLPCRCFMLFKVSTFTWKKNKIRLCVTCAQLKWIVSSSGWNESFRQFFLSKIVD